MTDYTAIYSSKADGCKKVKIENSKAKNNEEALKTAKKNINSTNNSCIYYLTNLTNIDDAETIYPFNGGSKNLLKIKKTTIKIKIGKIEKYIYEGPRGGKYIKIKGKFKSLSKIKQ